MLKPVKMKKFYLAVQRSHEVRTLEEIGRLGAVQLISERASIGEEPENLELYDGFIRMCERSRGAFGFFTGIGGKVFTIIHKTRE